ncbi:BTB/POZ domain-containing protein At5g60050 [Andrographis paniculata]|uniref:BTB/POZ domain-containing protein At5g60050 n=1 Tax=Andrographis paniculata TaxID=175694 RepID=UPI0021E71017|nr:BTB/POZ domain-containing protein At5g60050 [Andrographis paniculata]
MASGSGGPNSPSSSSSSMPKSPFSRTMPNREALVSSMIRQGIIPNTVLSPPRVPMPPAPAPAPAAAPTPAPQSEALKTIKDAVSDLMLEAPFRDTDKWGASDVRLNVVARSMGYHVAMDVHSRVLVSRSRFFADKLRTGAGTEHTVEICDCDDVPLYVEAISLMYYQEDLKNILRTTVPSKVVDLLQVFYALLCEDWLRACLEYLDSIPWTDHEEDLIVTQLNEFSCCGLRADGLLQRVKAIGPSTSTRGDEVFLQLSNGVLQAKDDKARNTMKALITRLIEQDEDNDLLDVSKDTIYSLCHNGLNFLTVRLSGVASVHESSHNRGALMSEIARAADNLLWIVKILIARKIGEDFVGIWAEQKDLSALHSKVPVRYRHEISKITAHICIAIGRGQILVSRETRFALLNTWLEPLYDDFKWLRMPGKSFDLKLFEEGLSKTILTLPLSQQQWILLDWFHRFLDRGDDCPNIQGAFETWWRRAFGTKYDDIDPKMQIKSAADFHQ